MDRAPERGLFPLVVKGWHAGLDTGDRIAPEGRLVAPLGKLEGAFLAAGRDA